MSDSTQNKECNAPKGGLYARKAAMLCQNRRFGLYLDQRWRAKHRLSDKEFPDGTFKAAGAANWLRKNCGIQSRAEIDHNDEARAMLDRIMADYSKWERKQRQNQGGAA